MFNKDTVRLIGKSFKRFFSLLMIVLIGSSFMMGLLSTREIMEKSVDRYNDSYSLQDIQLRHSPQLPFSTRNTVLLARLGGQSSDTDVPLPRVSCARSTTATG